MRTETDTRYSIPAPGRNKSYRPECDDSITTIYELARKLPMLAFVTLLATSPASEHNGLEQVQTASPLASLFEAVSHMEKATSLSLENDSLENFLHKLVRTTCGEASQQQEDFAIPGLELGSVDFLNDLAISPATPFSEIVKVNVVESSQKLPTVKDLDLEPLYILDELF